MTIDVDRIAELSKLNIEQDKKQVFEKQMNEIVGMADVLSGVDDGAAEEIDAFAPLRDDTVIENGLSPDRISRNAPCFENGCFCVPKTVE